MHLHHLQEILSFEFAKVTKIIKICISKDFCNSRYIKYCTYIYTCVCVCVCVCCAFVGVGNKATLNFINYMNIFTVLIGQ